MEERYEIRGTLGKGGLGTVYRAYDRSLKREVAIKRIIAGEDGQTEEAARQMEQETGALAALQHPHIVTIYDVGTDDDGPFVVMELLKGNTLDELVEKAPLTWPDFRNLVQQIMEGLIAAQDLGLLHRDLKPSNVMINWLPSGKFQAKIVDFGLAKFSPKPSSQTLDHHDSVYGSIFYMAPEQFERAALDTRTDMYAIGCVYYFTLTGQAPFHGETGPQVMASHLEHRVVPLADLRPDIPQWAADWVMWHINRTQEERPENAREALKNFIELDVPVTESMSNGKSENPPEETPAPKRPRLIIPGAEPQPSQPSVTPAPDYAQAEPPQPVPPVPTPQPVQPVTSPQPEASPPAPASQTGPVPPPPVKQTSPQPLMPPEGAPPSIHTTSQQADASAAETAPDAPPPAPTVQPATPSAPKLVVPGAQPAPPAPSTSGQPMVAQPVPTAPVGQAPQPTGGQATVGGGLAPRKKGLGGGAKIAIAIVLAIVVLILGGVVLNTMSTNKINKRYNELVAIAADPATKELPVTSSDLDILLNSVRAGSNKSRETVYKALAIATAKGSTDVDSRIAEFATTEVLPDEIRIALLERVLRRRADPSTLPYLLKFARETDNERAAAAALTAVTDISGEDEIDNFLEVIQFTSSDQIRRAAEKATASILDRSATREKYGSSLATAADNTVNDDTRRTMLRLLGHAGGDVALERVTKALEGDDNLDTLAALQAIESWPDDSLFEDLIAFLETQTDDLLRRKTFDSAFGFLMDADRAGKRDEMDSEEYWKMLARNAKTQREQLAIISGLAKTETADWALSVVEYFADEAESDQVIDQAEKAIRHMRERAKIKGE